ncbi:MAG TPA: hypothetical protein VGM83_05835 [Devosiaceae bacterium]|jgi:hypothetical protein
MKLSGTLDGEPAGLLKDLLGPKSKPGFDSWQQARRTGKLKMGGVILAERQQWNDRRPFSRQMLRVQEIERIIKWDCGAFVPRDLDDADMFVEAVAGARSEVSLFDWAAIWTPGVSSAVVEAIASRHDWRRHMQSADDCAVLLGMTWVKREWLSLKTIGAVDVSHEDRQALAAERKRIMERERQAAKRRAEGRLSRIEYEASSLSKTKPWETMGMKRSTWYSKGKPMPETGVLEVVVSSISTSNTPVSPQRIVPALPIATTTDNRLALRRAMGARGNLVPSHLLGARK